MAQLAHTTQAEQAVIVRFSLSKTTNLNYYIIFLIAFLLCGWLLADKRYLGLTSELLYSYLNNPRTGGGVMANVIIVLAPDQG